jgi:hypothetical protein
MIDNWLYAAANLSSQEENEGKINWLLLLILHIY